MITELAGMAVTSQALCSPEKLHTNVESLGVREELKGECIDHDRAHKNGMKTSKESRTSRVVVEVRKILPIISL